MTARHLYDSGTALSSLDAERQLGLMRTLIDSAVDAIIAHETDGTLVFYSGGACDLLGMSRDEMDALGPYGWVAPEAIRGAAQRLDAILSGEQLVFRSAVRRADRTIVPTEVTARRVDTEPSPLIVAVIRDVSRRTASMDDLTRIAFNDPLTGLANRQAFEDRLALAIADVVRYGDLLLLAYIDLDRFKPINDRYGHQAGDEVLMEIGKRLSSCVRVQDLVARMGGDEFVVLLERVESTLEVEGIATRLLAEIRRPVTTCGVDCEVDASIGFAIFDAEKDDGRSLVTKADVAMYAAKSDSGHRWRLYEDNMGTSGPHS